MPMIEGLDDEVTVLMTVLLMLMALVVAWLSTNLPNSQENEEEHETPAPRRRAEGEDVSAEETETSSESEPIVTEPEEIEPEPEPSTSGTSGFTAETNEAEIPDFLEGEIRVKLKYLDDRMRCVRCSPDIQIGEFKRNNFSTELGQDLLVRLIHNGRELQPDKSLTAYNIQDLSVIHCLVTPTNRAGNQNQTEAELTDLDLSNLMLPLFTLILALIWYCRIMYRNFFNAMSTLALVGITILYLFTMILTWRSNLAPLMNRHRAGRDREQHAHAD